MHVVRTALVVILAACAGSDGSDADRPGADDGAPTDTDPAVDTDPKADTDVPPDTDLPSDTATTPPWVLDVDCTSIPAGPRPYTRLSWAPGAEDFTFTPDGYMLSVTAGGLKRTPFGGPPEVLIPGLGDVRGTRMLPDGRVALAHIEDGSIVVADLTTGGWEVVAAGLPNPNGIAIGLDGRIYVATLGAIRRVDPATGDVDIIADMPGNSFDGITFSPDFTRLYFNEENGQVHWVDLDAAGAPTGPIGGPIEIPNGIALLDGLSMDACGNLYVIQMGGTVYRVWLDGTIEVVLDIGGIAFIPAMNFGYPPVGGWGNEMLYVLDFTGSVYEVEMGVPGKWEPHLPPAN